jgi:predicted nucleic acid-binding protein
MIYIIDSWAWIEYLIGSEKGFILKRLMDNKNHKFITMECTLSELKSYCLRTNSDFSNIRSIVKRNSIVLPVLAAHWTKAAQIKHEMRKKVKDFGLIDSILITKQREFNCKIISGDKHFKGMKYVIYIGTH